MAHRQQAHAEHDAQQVDKLNYKIKQAIRYDRKQYRFDNMAQELWTDIKSEKKGYMPIHTKLEDSKGNVVTSKQRPEVLADHFEKIHWAYDASTDPKIPNTTAEHANPQADHEMTPTTLKKPHQQKRPMPQLNNNTDKTHTSPQRTTQSLNLLTT